MKSDPSDPRRNPDGSLKRSAIIAALRSVLVDGKSKRKAAKELGCSESTFYPFFQRADLVDAAYAGAPSDDDEEGSPSPPPPAPRPADGDGPTHWLSLLPPIGAENPDNPSPVMMLVVANRYAINCDMQEADDLAGWPRGSVARWFERAIAGDPGATARVAILRRARAIMTTKLTELLLSTENPAAIRRLLEIRAPADWTPGAAEDDGIDELGLDRIEAELERRGAL